MSVIEHALYRLRGYAGLIAVLAAVMLGGMVALLWSPERVLTDARAVIDLTRGAPLDPVQALPRTELMLVVENARRRLAEDRPWTAWSTLSEHLSDPDEAPPAVVLLGARAAVEWSGWGEVRRLLAGRRWLDQAEGGEGWYLLGRAEEGSGRTDRAIAAYERFIRVGSGQLRGLASARLAQIHLSEGNHSAAATAFSGASEDLPTLADWFQALEVDVLADAGERPPVQTSPQGRGGSPPVRARFARATARAWLAAGDTAEALDLLENEIDLLRSAGSGGEAGPLQVERAAVIRGRGRANEARAMLAAVALDETAPPAAREEAADMLEASFRRLSLTDELARADAYEAVGRTRDAATALGAALAAGADDEGVLRLRMGHLYWEGRDHGRARSSFERAERFLADDERRSDAALYAARATFRAGQRAAGLAGLRSVTQRYPRTAAAGSAHFLLGDLETNVARAIQHYRNAFAIRDAPEAAEAGYRLGDRLIQAGETASGIQAWESLIDRHPRGETSARAAFRLGLLHERAGRSDRARAMFDRAISIDPISYYAMRSGEKIDRNPLEVYRDRPARWSGSAADPVEAEAVVVRLRLLDHAGLDEAWEEEFQAAERRFRARPAARIVIAEGLVEMRRVPEAIRIGRELVRHFDGDYDTRVLRVVFPLPWREALLSEAERAGVDPMLMAGLVRQESLWQPRVASWVGAAGLAQIMPATGQWLAPQVGIQGYRREMLENPEISLRMGTFYLASLIRRYDGHEDLALAGYNAGPARADRWRSSLGHARDQDMFRERIPFEETNHYVKVVLRNRTVYQHIYG